jgi:hypothetical protein
LAVQDAVAAANILYEPLRAGTLDDRDLAAVERRRTFPTRVTQAVQVFVQDRIFRRVLAAAPATSTTATPVPWPVKLLRAFPVLQRLPARFVGVGVRPEHVRTPEVKA